MTLDAGNANLPDLRGRVALVTGAGRGIGAAIARALAGAGAGVVLAARTITKIEAMAEELRRMGARSWPIDCDVTDEDSVLALGRAARQHAGAIDILVNNAGAGASAPLAKITLEEWNWILTTNATGTFLCSREFVPDMVARNHGRVINIASTAGLEGGRYISHYSAAKHAVVGFTRSIALELADTGVTANALCPAYVDTPMTQRTLDNVQARAGIDRDQALTRVLGTTGQPRLLSPDEVAAAVLSLCGDDAGGRSGETILIGTQEDPRWASRS